MLESYEETLTISLIRYNGLLRKSTQYDFMVDFLLNNAFISEWGSINFGSIAVAAVLDVLEPEAVAEREADLKAKRQALKTEGQLVKEADLIKGGGGLD